MILTQKEVLRVLADYYRSTQRVKEKIHLAFTYEDGELIEVEMIPSTELVANLQAQLAGEEA